MRLSTVDRELARRISQTRGINLQRAAVAACKAAANHLKPTEPLIAMVLKTLENGEDVSPEEKIKLSKLAIELDEIYFELTEAEDSEGALIAFSKARLYSAVLYALVAKQPDQAAECIYEAWASLDEPSEVLDAAAEAL